MPKKVTAKLGIEGKIKDIELEIPDSEPAPWDADDQLTVVNQSVARLDALAKVTGRAKYTYDVKLSGLLYGKILRSPHPAAVVKRIDASKAERLPGVKAVHIIADPGDPAKGTIKFAGQEVAAVAAESPERADDAIRLIEVEYERKPFVVDTDKARQADAPLVHAQQVQERRSEGDAPAARGVRVTQHGNARTQTRDLGKIEQGLAQADVVVEATYRTQVQTHCCLETHGVVAQWEGDQLTVWSSTQGTFSVRDDLARYFNIPATKVRVITEYMGGGFGSKFGIRAFEPAAAELA
ncbi:MAG: xanthine dehydrogenase family protein molybdopterin-binding subunit, partial [Acidobacteria bacterium]|nr:xanthine dehydrogenase family protein molybdopterin-binding subunit [Acidobacteriota bacterium]